MVESLPAVEGIENYKRIPFEFTEECKHGNCINVTKM